ncbi:hypothetical protein GCM10027085_55110 [Spirosoma aerophilum]
MPGAVAQPAGLLRQQFQNPPASAKVYVWWHWMGSNFSKTGITKDLEAMKAAGIGGATIFNLTSAVQETQSPTQNNPWPGQTYRSPAYWDALKHAAAEAQRLGLELGLHNTVGYSTTGGPWITEERAMQQLVWTRTSLSGGQPQNILLPEPAKPIFKGWGSINAPLLQATRFTDIVVLAVPIGRTPAVREVVNLTARMSKTGQLQWQAPPGEWAVYRIGYSPTMAVPHPLPDELIGKVLEVNKLDADQSRFHWQSVLEPLKTHLGPYLGKSFGHVLIDSYEAGDQNWTPTFQREFVKRKGYDPLPWLLCLTPDPNAPADRWKPLLLENDTMTRRFLWDYRDVISQLYFDNGWAVGQKLVQQAGLKLYMEPYSGPFDTAEGATLADMPMDEFWTHRPLEPESPVPAAGRAAGKTLVGAEAFTGRPEVSQWTEDPAFLKPGADLAFVGGINRLVLHHWVHQPFDDRYQPGMGMGWWGTHFSRHQTWAKPGKAFFTYLNRCQTLLQTGQQVVDYLCVGKLVGNADLVSDRDFLKSEIRVVNRMIVLPSGRTYPFMVFPNQPDMPLAVARKIKTLVAAGARVVAAKPTTTPGLVGYPAVEDSLQKLVREVWGPDTTAHTYGLGRILPTVADALRDAQITPDVIVEHAQDSKNIISVHRRTQGEDLYFVANQTQKSQSIPVSFRVNGKQPELWQAEDGSVQQAPVWQEKNGRTTVWLSLKPMQSIFVVFRKAAPVADHPIVVRVADSTAHWTMAITQDNKSILQTTSYLSAEVLYASGKTAKTTLKAPRPTTLNGDWTVSFVPKLDQPFTLTLPNLIDFSQHSNPAVRYFAGSATYQKNLTIRPADRKANQRIILDLGALHNIAEVRLNGTELGVLWYPPYQIDLTDALKIGENKLAIVVTNNWANRLIGDEQEPIDFEWGQDREDKGRAIKGYPDWFIQQKPRPSTGRKAFTVWYYHRKDSPLQPAGLVGPVRLLFGQQAAL